ncbi:DUF6090 family protein [Winogradskyella aurantia]|nr:DUF6090 family protein [Winogradskyella aurantia]
MKNQTSKPASQTGRYFKYAIGEIILVVIGILIALQINSWNENRKNQIKERIILNSFLTDLNSDIGFIEIELKSKKIDFNNYIECLDILANRKKANKETFFKHYNSILAVGGLALNTTTFENIKASSQLGLIRNKSLNDEIVKYYTIDYEGWYSALSDYTRNITAPYILSFDYKPFAYVSKYIQEIGIKLPDLDFDFQEEKLVEYSDYNIEEKSLEDYKNNIFIINTLRQKAQNIQGIMYQLKLLSDSSEKLKSSIENYLTNND